MFFPLKLFVLILTILTISAHGFGVIQSPIKAFEIAKNQPDCQEKLTNYAKSMCGGDCKEGFEEFIQHACQSQVSDLDILNACCSPTH
ncbi:hypothetical protein B9Z55_003234 [Caenorhabditis nigoni]|uniref:Uncharacterized protein n=1 Tax=Caenorhabditis nigoni TaxID=1611254 RepID=A0A2G5VPT3_9PELO|nr:hypothetical protein B9Z55_003234 [Caenorhabditis nigoni]